MKRIMVGFALLITALNVTGCGTSSSVKDQNYPQGYQRGTFQLQETRPIYKLNPSVMEGRLNAIPGIAKASVVVYGDSIFVGFRRHPNYPGSDIALKRKILNSLQSDARYNQLYVVGDDELVPHIERISQRIHNGQPVSRTELQNLMNDVGLKIESVNLIQKT
jgi:hypothetical protein